MQLLKENGEKAIVLASAGNTGRAFAHVSALTGTDVYIVVPDSRSFGTVAARRAYSIHSPYKYEPRKRLY